MSVDNWIRLGAGIWVGASLLIILLVYIGFVVQIVPAEPDEQAEEQPPDLDDETRYQLSTN